MPRGSESEETDAEQLQKGERDESSSEDGGEKPLEKQSPVGFWSPYVISSGSADEDWH